MPCYEINLHELKDLMIQLQNNSLPITVFFWYPGDDQLPVYSYYPFTSHEAAVDEIEKFVQEQRTKSPVKVEGIPFCKVPDRLRAKLTWVYPSPHSSTVSCNRIEACSGCEMRSDCPGIPQAYLDQWGVPQARSPH